MTGQLKKGGEEIPVQPAQSSRRTNPVEEKKIDDYIEKNPTQWEYWKSQDPEIIARKVMQNAADRKIAVDNHMWESIQNDPAKKRMLQGLVKNFPKEEQKGAMIGLEKQIRQQTNKSQTQTQSKSTAVAV